jgi:hypothetical protein
MKVTIPEMQLVLWEKRELPERTRDLQTNEWRNTGQKVERTQYTLRDEFGDTLKFLADNEYRQMEGSQVQVVLDIEFNEYQNKNIVKLDSLIQVD